MATRKKAEEAEQAETYTDVELIEEPLEAAIDPLDEKVTLSVGDLRALIAEEVRKATGQAERKAYTVKPKVVRPRVKIKLFKDNGRYSKPVFVAVNGHKFIVPRGVEVEVPDYIAKVLNESFRQDQETANQLMELERKFSEDTKKLR